MYIDIFWLIFVIFNFLLRFECLGGFIDFFLGNGVKFLFLEYWYKCFIIFGVFKVVSVSWYFLSFLRG